MRKTYSCDMPALTRRELFCQGGLTVAGYHLLPMLAPRNVVAQTRVEPRGSADCVVFLNLLGGPAQMDTFDVKEGKWGPENRDVRMTRHGYQFPYGLFPKLANCLNDLLIVRSMEAWETVHSRGQYYLQTGHAVSPARMKEMPSLGAVIAYETQRRRRATDFLPPFLSMNYNGNNMYGPLQREGCLPSSCSPLTLDLQSASLPFVVQESERARFERRWAALNEIDTSRKRLNSGVAQEVQQFNAFGNAVHQMMINPAISKIIQLDEGQRKKYGSTLIGDACLITRNMIAADAGAKFFLLTHGDWDHHSNIYGTAGKGGIYQKCAELDGALSALLADLKATKGSNGAPLLDRTLVVVMGEFGRTPGPLTVNRGREHYAKAMSAAFAGAGVKGGRALGATDAEASKVVEYGWNQKRPIYMEDVAATIYSVLGIDWTKRLTKTPSGRDFVYVDPASGQGVIPFREVSEFFG